MPNIYMSSGAWSINDAFACAALRITGFDYPIRRVDMLPDNIGPQDITFNITGGKFNSNKDVKRNGVVYLSFGLIVKEFYERMGLSSEAYSFLDTGFITEIEREFTYADRFTYTLKNILEEEFRERVYSTNESIDKSQDNDFDRAVNVAIDMLNKAIKFVCDKVDAKKYADSLIDSVFHHTVFMDKNILYWFYPTYPDNPEIWYIVRPCGAIWRMTWLLKGDSSIFAKFSDNKNWPKGIQKCDSRPGVYAEFVTKEDAYKFVEQYL